MIRLYHAPMSSCSQKVRFVLEQKELAWEERKIDLHAGENLTSEFLKLNSKGVVPVLVDDGDIYLESNNICIYLDEKYPQVSMMPASAKGKSDVRTHGQHIDEYVHSDIAALTYGIAFRPDLLETFDTPEKLTSYLDSIPDIGKRHFRKNMITQGTESIEFVVATKRLYSLLNRLDRILQNNDFLVENTLSVADAIYAPYVTRLDHLSLSLFWKDMPNVESWYKRIRATKGYEQGIQASIIDAVKEKMSKAGKANIEKVRAILES